MMARKHLVLTLVIVTFTLSGAAGILGVIIGHRLGQLRTLSRLTFDRFTSAPFGKLPAHRQLLLSTEEAFRTYLGTDGQDRWIALVVFPDVKDGYYLDVGAGDGVHLSNTKMLDERGWKGICIDPFPANMETRTAKVFREVVSSEKGQKVRFRPSGFLGGIEDYFNFTKDWEPHKQHKALELTTTTLDDILARANAPNYIHYMSLDIEGAEMEALKGFSFSKYKVGALTVEHNWEEPKRSLIRALLESRGYRRVFANTRDDYYLHHELITVPRR